MTSFLVFPAHCLAISSLIFCAHDFLLVRCSFYFVRSLVTCGLHEDEEWGLRRGGSKNTIKKARRGR